MYKFANKKKKNPDDPDDDSVSTSNKKTGDDTPLQLMLGLFFLALMGCGITYRYKKKLKE